MSKIIDAAEVKKEKDALFKQANEVYAALRENEQAWQEELVERSLWDVTLEDGETDKE